MTRKDYKLLADALRSVRPDGIPMRFEAWQFAVHAVADALAQDNPRFNLSRFLEAAGAHL